MKNLYPLNYRMLKPILLVTVLMIIVQTLFAQPATVSNPLAIGQNCGGGSNNFKSFTYDSVLKKITQVGSNCNPSLASPGFNPGGGSIAFSPKDQKVFYIETTTGNNSIVWSWTPGVCPGPSQAALYTYNSTFIVGLEFNSITGDGYQLEFSTGSAPYNIFLRKVTSFGPPLVAGAPQQIFLPAGKNIYQQNGDVVITPTGKMYFVLDNKMFSLDYSPYGTGTLNANYIDTLKNGASNNVIGLSFVNGNFIASILGSTCTYSQIDISTGAAVVQPVTLTTGTFISYDMATMVTGIGVAKRINSVSLTSANHYQVDYDIKVKDYGNVNLNSVQLQDSVAKIFGASFVSASVTAVGTLPTGLTLNPSFNGQTNANIFSAGSTMKASPADSATVRVTVNLLNPIVSNTYLNSAIVTATGAIFSNNLRDSSHNQMLLDPDPIGKGVPDNAGEGVPTPLNINSWILLGDKIVDFNAKSRLISNELSWTLDNQQQVNTILIQRSHDGNSFETVATLKSNGSNREQFNWSDNHPLTADNYYRLVVVPTTSSKKLFSGVVLIRKLESSAALTVNPNPFLQTLKFSLPLTKPYTIKYRILNYVSAVMKSGQFSGHEGTNDLTITNLEEIPPGTYILEVTAGEQHCFKKIVKLQ